MSRAIKTQRSPLTDVMEYYGDDMTRENYIATNYVGSVSPDDSIPGDVEDGWPEQFRRGTLLNATPWPNKIQ